MIYKTFCLFLIISLLRLLDLRADHLFCLVHTTSKYLVKEVNSVSRSVRLRKLSKSNSWARDWRSYRWATSCLSLRPVIHWARLFQWVGLTTDSIIMLQRLMVESHLPLGLSFQSFLGTFFPLHQFLHLWPSLLALSRFSTLPHINCEQLTRSCATWLRVLQCQWPLGCAVTFCVTPERLLTSPGSGFFISERGQ